MIIGAAELAISAALAILFHFQAVSEKRRIILQSNIVAMSYALQPEGFEMSSTRYFYEFGYPGITSVFKDPMHKSKDRNMGQANFTKFSILLKRDAENEDLEKLENMLANPREYRVQETANEVIVNVPLYHGKARNPYGIVQIATNISNLSRDVFYKNFFLYLAIFLLYNSQILLIYLYRRQRKRETVIYLEKGYLKEHAIGALKLQHKILGDIIADHEDIESPPKAEISQRHESKESPKVVLLEKRIKNTGRTDTDKDNV